MKSANCNSLFDFDNSFSSKLIIGTDEAGRGPAAGGVFAAAVCFLNPPDDLIKELSRMNDSKKLSPKTREELFDIIFQNTVNSISCVEVEEIEKINILNASLKAMQISCNNVINRLSDMGYGAKSFKTLVDGNKIIKNYDYDQEFVIKGDGKSASIAAASILAKVSRDRYMCELDSLCPQYLWRKNAGYLTREHLEAIDNFGLTKFHRKSFLKKHFEEKKCNTQQLTLYRK